MRLRYVNLWEVLFPSELRQAVLRHVVGLLGFVLLALALALGICLASWSPGDPSLNRATGEAVRNWLGTSGAVVADIAMQTSGVGAVFVALVLAAWGWRLARGGALRRPLRRLAATLVGLGAGSALASAFAAPASWPLATGLGGVVGDAIFSVAVRPVAAATGSGAGAATASVLAVVALAAGWYASAIGLGGGGASPSVRQRSSRAGGEADGGAAAALDALGALGRGAWWLASGLGSGVGGLLGWRRKQEQSRLKIAMARASEGEADDLDWRPSGQTVIHRPLPPGGEPETDARDDWDGRQEAADAPAAGEAKVLGLFRRLWGAPHPADPSEVERRVEPDLSKTAGAGRGFAPPAGSAPETGWDEQGECGEEAGDAAPEPAKPKRRKRKAPAGNTGFDFGADDAEYQLPPLTLLNTPSPGSGGVDVSDDLLAENARQLEGVLEDFGVRGEIINVRPGPVVTLYELEPAPGIKSSRVIGLADDIARSMSAISARVAVVPGRNVIGIELPNEKRETVFLYDLLASKEYHESRQTLAIGLGKNIGGEPIIADLARMPHLLVAGTTGSGKSVGVNAMILSLLFKMRPDECKLIMIDPKMLELSVYDGIPHLLSPVVTEPGKAVVALKWAVREMEDRYKKMSKLGVRNIDGFNKRVREAEVNGEVLTRTVQTGFNKETGQAVYETEEMELAPLPYIVVIVDEMADLMMVAGKDIEGAIQRLAQMARAAGLHLIMATQRPSVDVITGTIKANFPTRISFQVTSKIDSRTILGEQGAEQLLGQGDMLHMAGGGRISRVHGAFVSDDEVESVVQFLKRQGVPEYLEAVTADLDGGGGDDGGFDPFSGGGGGSEADQLYDQAVAIVARDRKASTSYIQRRLSIGYNRAATIIERMENEGVVGPANHAGKREVLAPEPSFEDP